jgi:hypothetical protein
VVFFLQPVKRVGNNAYVGIFEMTFGFSALNDDLKTTLSTGFPLMKFAGKASIFADTNWQTIALGIYFREIVFLTPSIPGGGTPTVFFYLPVDGVRWMPTYLVPVGDGTWKVGVQCNEISTPPTVYCFYATPAAAAAETQGMRLFAGDTGLIFDSGWPKNTFLNVREIASIVASSASTVTIGARTKPAFPFRFNYNEIYYHGYIQGAHYFAYYFLGLKRVSMTFTVGMGALTCVAVASTAWTTTGISDGKTHYLPIIEGADYD